VSQFLRVLRQVVLKPEFTHFLSGGRFADIKALVACLSSGFFVRLQDFGRISVYVHGVNVVKVEDGAVK